MLLYTSKNRYAFLCVASLCLLVKAPGSYADTLTRRKPSSKRHSAIHKQLAPESRVATEESASEIATNQTAKPRDSFRNLASRGQSIARTAIKYQGSPYSYGGTSLQNGIDCSAFVQAIYSQFGMNLPRVARQQFNVGEPVEREDLMPGDLVFFKNTSKSGISHVGMFIGNGKFIHAAGVKKGIIISPLDSKNYLKSWAGARRPGFQADAIDEIVTRTKSDPLVEIPIQTRHRVLIDADDAGSSITESETATETEVPSKSDRHRRQTKHSESNSSHVDSEILSNDDFIRPPKRHVASKR